MQDFNHSPIKQENNTETGNLERIDDVEMQMELPGVENNREMDPEEEDFNSDEYTIAVLEKMIEKYSELVWWARHEKGKGPPEKEEIIEKKHRDDICEFKKHPDWIHGFNTGAMSAFRLALKLQNCSNSKEITEALNQFPVLKLDPLKL